MVVLLCMALQNNARVWMVLKETYCIRFKITKNRFLPNNTQKLVLQNSFAFLNSLSYRNKLEGRWKLLSSSFWRFFILKLVDFEGSYIFLKSVDILMKQIVQVKVKGYYKKVSADLFILYMRVCPSVRPSVRMSVSI